MISKSSSLEISLITPMFNEEAEIKNNVDYIVNLHQDKIMKIPSQILLINKNGSIKILR